MAIISCEEHRFENIEAVLFDKDGTLADVESYLLALCAARAEAVEHLVSGVQENILVAFGTKNGYLNPAGMMAVGSRAENVVAAAAYVAAKGVGWIAALDLVEEAFEKAEKHLAVENLVTKNLVTTKAEQTPPLPGAIALLQRLSDSDVKVGIVSSDTHAEVAAFVERYGLNVSWYCGAGGAALSKSQAGFLDLTCKAINVAPSGVLIIGDSASDVLLANQGSAGFVGMTGGWSAPPTFSPDTVTIAQLSQVQVSDE